MVRVELLGSGNAFLPSGRHHSFLCIERHIIVDAPPTALASLRRAGISPSDIDTILITHVHGDHVFGFPFLLLERRYISDREMERPLTVAGSSGVKSRLIELCNLAYPGSLDQMLKLINWVDLPEINRWTFERFEVNHDPEVDPHGWMMTHDDGWKMLHSGDSGPCDELWNRIGQCNFVILEMGVPEWVDTQHHHKPSDIRKIANMYPETTFIVTHTYVDSDYEILTNEIPVFPANVIHGNDEMVFIVDNDGSIMLQ
ncbi:MAG: MBL fold metallo-hydrolase [Candidatus Poseidoniaceae archaeon]|nr:MBL fold metallo-hydrolase [Candidatus Poseidoniaceae archaeon]